MTVNLELDDWNKVLSILAQAPWATVNPLIMAMGEQLRQQQPKGLHEDELSPAAARNPRPNGEDVNRA